MKIENIVYSLIAIAILFLGIYVGKAYMPDVVYVEKPIVTHEVKTVEVPKIIEKPVIEYVNRTIIKEVPKVEYKEVVKTVEIVKEPTLDFKNMLIDYLREDFDECEGFNFSGFVKEEITLIDVDNIEFTVKYDDEDKVYPEFSNINLLVEYKYKAEDLPREYHKFNVTINYDNEDNEIMNCSMVQIS